MASDTPRSSIVIVTPALADANNGNWQTARRWARMLASAYRMRLTRQWSAEADGEPPAVAMIALHARRSAESIAAWRAVHGPAAPLVVALTGTDLYRDIHADASARRSLELADRLIVLNGLGANAVPAMVRHKVHVVLQSCAARAPRAAKPTRHLRAVVVGHLRDEKDPRTVFAAVRQLADRHDIRIDHIGAALDPALADAARACMAAHPGYRWLGARPHAETRRRIQAAHVLVHPSRMEGGAHVVLEALRSGTPILASRIDGNLGLLGGDWPGVFDAGDADALATLLRRTRDDADMLTALNRLAARRAPLFAPEAESARLRGVLDPLIHSRRSSHP
jgi:putative glycosyltransferase (TIGR04348 family)